MRTFAGVVERSFSGALCSLFKLAVKTGSDQKNNETQMARVLIRLPQSCTFC
jgi:hypothetical protein